MHPQGKRLAWLLLVLTGVGCSGASLWQAGLGGFAPALSVERLATRGDYLEARLVGDGLAFTLYAPNDEICGSLLRAEGTLDYVERGLAGGVEREGVTCEAVGIGEPLVQGARRPRVTSASPIPRKPANFTLRFEDEEVLMLRGRFPLAGVIGWPGGSDTIAVVPNTEACRHAIEGGVASMEYRASGRDTLSLVSDQGLCRIVGLVRPLESR